MVWPKRRSFPFHRLVASSNRCCLHLPSSSSSPLLFFSSPPHHPQHYYPEHCLWISLARVFVIDSTKSVSIYMCYLGILEISLTDPLHFNQTSFTCPSPPPPSSSCAFAKMRLRSNHVLPPISEYVPRRRRTTRSASAAGTDAASEITTTAPDTQETVSETQSAGERPAPKRKPAKKAGRKKVSTETRCHNCSYLTHVSRRPP